ncbi:class I SAM-dependent methyltransferase [Litorilinea aerophila]|uniref:Class I SAM-dependent methyltransferase n=1 Tax=Litorilinea aerophila TaxID=1204385 RepID=A0A540VAE3_9CHLR|nr:class I SAM-dependent methyltransferase [Litorilinea aerophila]MCC9078402.1 class I SAM-dependent methyltransferase [Litorilinea aerophila]GIV76045.1 MAG: hypothetical protein KatS3mg050_0439 [Litorilinea sp.]
MTPQVGAMLASLYERERQPGWSSGMRAVTRALLADLALPPGPLLELGCGGGAMLAELAATFPDRPVYGLDLWELALRQARRGLSTGDSALVQGDLQRLPFPAQHFALVLALDAFDQRGVDFVTGIRESWRILQVGGMLVMRVSAHPWLYSAHDVAFNTGARYSATTVRQALEDAGLEVIRLTYANFLWFVPVAVLRLLQRWGILPFRADWYQSARLQRAMAGALTREAAWLARRNLPIGLSLYALARKRPAHRREGCG